MNKPRPLSDFATVFNGKTPAVSEQRAEGHPVLKIKDVDDLGCFRGAFESFVDRSLAESFRHKWIEMGDTLILNAAHNANYVGSKTYYASNAVSGVLPTGEWLVVRGLPGQASKRYLHHWLTSAKTRSQIRDRVKGIHLYPKDVADLPITLPACEQQERIATILDIAETIRRKRREALRLTDEFLRSAFLDLFGDPMSNPKGWPTIQLGEYTEFMTSGSRGWAEYYAESGSKFLRIQNVGRNRLLLDDLAYVTAPVSAEARRTLVKTGDLLISITADLGRCAVVPADFGAGHINQHLALIRMRELNPHYVSSFLDSSAGKAQFARLNREGVKAGLNFDDLRSLQVLKPPAALQEKYTRAFEHARILEAKHSHQLAESDSLFKSLQQRAFSGKLAIA